MASPLLLLITGPPCTGKTTLARRIAAEFGLPLFTKDGFKERMFDILDDVGNNGREECSGAAETTDSGRETSRLLGRISMGAPKVAAETLLMNEQSLILEANFDSALFSHYLHVLKAQHPCRIAQIQLLADGQTLLARFVQREAAERHPVHQGLKHLDSIRPVLLRGEQPPLLVEGDLLTLDTTDFARFPYERVQELIARLMAAG